jgi:hypothetical protein
MRPPQAASPDAPVGLGCSAWRGRYPADFFFLDGRCGRVIEPAMILKTTGSADALVPYGRTTL